MRAAGTSSGHSASARWAATSLVLLAFTVAPWGREAAEQTAVRWRIDLELDALASLAGLHDARGVPQVSTALPVEVAQEGGPAWFSDALRERVENHPAFELASSRHLLRGELVTAPRFISFALRLDRRGWSLRAPEPAMVSVRPYVVAGALAVALATYWFTRLGALAALLLGLAAQALAWATAPQRPAGPALPRSWPETSADGLVEILTRWSAAVPERAAALFWGVIALCVLGIALDHWRSRGRGGRMLLSVPLVILGLLAFLDAALRTHAFAYAATLPGGSIMTAALLTAAVAIHLRSDRSVQ